MAKTESPDIGKLPVDARCLLVMLAAIEPAECKRSIVERLWPATWKGSGREDDAPPFAEMLACLQEANCLTEHPLSVAFGGGGEEDAGDDEYHLAIHPEAAKAALESAPEGFVKAARASVVQFWTAMLSAMRGAKKMEDKQGALARSIGYATPYLLKDATSQDRYVFIDEALAVDSAPATWMALLPQFRVMVDAAESESNAVEASTHLCQALVASEQYDEASLALPEALKKAEELGLTRERAVLLSTLSALERLQGRSDAALALLRQALALAYEYRDKRLCCRCHLELAACIDVSGHVDKSATNRLAAGVIAMLCRFDILEIVLPQMADDLRLHPAGLIDGRDPNYQDLARSVQAEEGLDLASLLEDNMSGRDPKDDPVTALIREAADVPPQENDALKEVFAELSRRSPEAADTLWNALERCVRSGVDAVRVVPVLSDLPAALAVDVPMEKLAETLAEMTARLDALLEGSVE